MEQATSLAHLASLLVLLEAQNPPSQSDDKIMKT